MAGGAGDGRAYGAFAGFVFIFNLIVGVGGLAMPQAFSKAGWLLGWPRARARVLGIVAPLTSSSRAAPRCAAQARSSCRSSGSSAT